jgi:RNA polymerase sigma-70 factor (ECF subfamily)
LEFYNRYKDRLFAYLMRMTADYDLSGDIMQEAFTRYLEHYGDKEEKVPLLYKIARNCLSDHGRKQKRVAPLDGDPGDRAYDQEHLLMVREEYRKVLDAMQRLAKDDRDILSLAVTGDLSYREISTIAGISEANVKVKVHRARVELRKLLPREEP